jgi:hypothetical protein
MKEEFENLLNRRNQVLKAIKGRLPKSHDKDMSINDYLATGVCLRSLSQIERKICNFTGREFEDKNPDCRIKAMEELLIYGREFIRCQKISEVYEQISRGAFPSKYIDACIQNQSCLDGDFIEGVIVGYPDLAQKAATIRGATGALFSYHKKLIDSKNTSTNQRLDNLDMGTLFPKKFDEPIE